jgi:hypothetical protein
MVQPLKIHYLKGEDLGALVGCVNKGDQQVDLPQWYHLDPAMTP